MELNKEEGEDPVLIQKTIKLNEIIDHIHQNNPEYHQGINRKMLEDDMNLKNKDQNHYRLQGGTYQDLLEGDSQDHQDHKEESSQPLPVLKKESFQNPHYLQEKIFQGLQARQEESLPDLQAL